MKETLRLDTYSLFEFCQRVQETIIAVWRFDFDSNENAPVAYGSMLTCGMIREELPVQEEKVVPEEVKEEQPESLVSQGSSSKKVTRKAKVAE